MNNEGVFMADESSTPTHTINIQITRPVDETAVQELVGGIQEKVGEAVQSWQDRLKERDRAAAQQPQSQEALEAACPNR